MILTALWRWFAHRWVSHLLVLACLSLALTQLAASFALHTGTERHYRHLRESRISRAGNRLDLTRGFDISIDDALSQTMLCMLTAASVVVCIFLIRSLVVDDLGEDRQTAMTLHGLGCSSTTIKGLFALRMFTFLGIASAAALGLGPRVAGWILNHLHRGAGWASAASECGLTSEQLILCLSTLAATVLIGMSPYWVPVVAAPTRLNLPRPVQVVAQILGAGLLLFVLHRLTRTSSTFNASDIYRTFFAGPFLLVAVYATGGAVPRILALLWSGRFGRRGNVLQSTFLKAIDAATIRSQSFMTSCVVGVIVSALLLILSFRYFANRVRDDLIICVVDTRHAQALEQMLTTDGACRLTGTGRMASLNLISHSMRVEAIGVPDDLGTVLLSITPWHTVSWQSSTTMPGRATLPACHLSTDLAVQLGIGPGASVILAHGGRQTTFMVVDVLPLPMEKGLLITLDELDRLTDSDRSIVIGQLAAHGAMSRAETRSRLSREAARRGFWFGCWITGATEKETDKMVGDITRFFPPMIVMFATLGGLTVTLVGIQNVRKSRRLYVCLHSWGMTSGQFLASTWPALVSLVLALSVLAWAPPFVTYRLVCDKISRRIILSSLPAIPIGVILETFGAAVLIAGISIALPRLVLSLRPGFGRENAVHSE